MQTEQTLLIVLYQIKSVLHLSKQLVYKGSIKRMIHGKNI